MGKTSNRKAGCRGLTLALVLTLALLLSAGSSLVYALNPIVIDGDSPDVVVVDPNAPAGNPAYGTDEDTGQPEEDATEEPAEPAEPSIISLDIEDAPGEIAVGEEYKLSYALKNSDSDVVWSSSDNNIAAIDDSGKVTGISPGKVQITASAGEVKASVMISVVMPQAASIRIVVQDYDEFEMAKSIHEMHVGDMLYLSVVAEPAGARTGGVEWSVSDPNIASIDQGGALIARTKGELTVLARAGELESKILFSVRPNGIFSDPFTRYMLIIGLALLLIVVIIILVVTRNRMMREDEEAARRAARKRRESEQAAKWKEEAAIIAERDYENRRMRDEGYIDGYMDRESDMTDRMTKIYDSVILENSKINTPYSPIPEQDVEYEPEGEDDGQPFSLDDIK